MTRILSLFLVTCAALSCNDIGGVCTLEARPAIDLEIRDSLTSAPIAENAVARVLDGAFGDSLRLCRQTNTGVWISRCGPYERAGTYDVLVMHASHQFWSVHGVRVSRDACHVRTVTLQVRMQLP